MIAQVQCTQVLSVCIQALCSVSFKLDVVVRAALAKFMRGAWFGGVGNLAVYAACGQGTGGRRGRERLKMEEDEIEEETEVAEAGRDMTGKDLKRAL